MGELIYIHYLGVVISILLSFLTHQLKVFPIPSPFLQKFGMSHDTNSQLNEA